MNIHVYIRRRVEQVLWSHLKLLSTALLALLLSLLLLLAIPVCVTLDSILGELRSRTAERKLRKD